MKRYLVTIQNPNYSNEVFIWDRKEKEVKLTIPYKDRSAADQSRAKAICEGYLADFLTQEEL